MIIIPVQKSFSTVIQNPYESVDEQDLRGIILRHDTYPQNIILS